MNTTTIEPMTEEQFGKIKYRCVCHLNIGTEHASTYESVDFVPKIRMCVHVPYKDGVPKGRSYAHYSINGKIFKTKAKAIEYINDLRANEQNGNTDNRPSDAD